MRVRHDLPLPETAVKWEAGSSIGSVPGKDVGDSQGGRPYGWICGVCGKHSASAIHLRRHRFMHQGYTQCPECSRVISTIQSLERHMLTKHDLPLPDGLPLQRKKKFSAKALKSVRARRAALKAAEAGIPGRQDVAKGVRMSSSLPASHPCIIILREEDLEEKNETSNQSNNEERQQREEDNKERDDHLEQELPDEKEGRKIRKRRSNR